MKAAEEMEEFLKQLRYLFYDIPAWEFLKVRDLRLSLIFKAKPTRNGCLLDCLHTPTAGLGKIFL